MARLSAYATDQEGQQTVRYDPFVTPTMNDRYYPHARRSRAASSSSQRLASLANRRLGRSEPLRVGFTPFARAMRERPLFARSRRRCVTLAGLPSAAAVRPRLDGHGTSNPRPRAAAPISAGRFMTTKPARQVLHKPLCDDLGHDLIRVVDALAALKAQGEGERVDQFRL